MKRFLSLFLAIVLAAGVLTATPLQLPDFVVSASAEGTTVPEGTTSTPEDATVPSEGDETPTPEYELKFSLINSNREYAVSGYTGTPINVIIPTEYEGKPVTSIADSAFYFCKTIKTLTIPNSVKSLGQSSFGSSTIEQVNIEDNGLTYIGDSAFDGCSSLKSIKLPHTIKIIGLMSFFMCKSLEEITIPENVKEIHPSAFSYCSNLKTLTFLGGVDSIAHNAFEYCYNIEKINLPETHVNLVASDFKGSKIYKDKNNWYGDSFYIGNQLINTTWYIHGTRTVRPGTTHINPCAYEGTKNLIAITIPTSVKYIGDNAFENSSISIIYYEGTESQFKQINLGNNITQLENMVVVCGINKSNIPKTPKVKSVGNVAGGVQIIWDKVANADLYAVYRRGTSSNKWTLLGVTTETAAIDTKADHRKFWRYSVQALNDDGVSNFDYNGKYLKYVETPKLTGLQNHKNGILLSWREVTGASGYRVYRREAGKSWKYLGTVKTTEYLDKAIKNNNGKYYRYTVRAVVDGRYSGFEDYLYTMRLTAPKLVSAKYNDRVQLVLKWETAPSATGYDIYGYHRFQNYWTYIGHVNGGKKTSYILKEPTYYNNFSKYSVVATNGKYKSELNTKGIAP